MIILEHKIDFNVIELEILILSFLAIEERIASIIFILKFLTQGKYERKI